MSESPFEDTETPFKVTLKGGGGYEAPWLTIDGESTEDLTEKLDAVTEDLLQKVADVAALFRAAHNVAAAGEAPTENSAGGATVTPISGGADLKTCEHGVRNYKSGHKNGKAWGGWFCPLTDKNAQCKPIWKD